MLKDAQVLVTVICVYGTLSNRIDPNYFSDLVGHLELYFYMVYI